MIFFSDESVKYIYRFEIENNMKFTESSWYPILFDSLTNIKVHR